MNPLETLKLEAASLNQGDSVRGFTCPWCGHDESGSVLRRVEGGLLFKCYHASCEKSEGYVFIPSVGNSYYSKSALNKEPKTRDYNHQLVPVKGKLRKRLKAEVDLTDAEIKHNRIMYNPENGSYVYTIFDFYGRQIGVVDRSYSGRKPKAITYPFTQDPILHFPHQQSAPDDPLILVEDIPSAIKVARYVRCAALLGSSLTRGMMSKALEVSKDIYLWMDDDVWQPHNLDNHKWKPLPIRYQQEYGYLCNKFNFLRTKDDPKDMPDMHIMEYLYEEGLL